MDGSAFPQSGALPNTEHRAGRLSPSSPVNLLTRAGYTSNVVLEIDHAIRRVTVRRYHLVIAGHSFSAGDQIAVRSRLKHVRYDLRVRLLASEQENPEVPLTTVAQCLERNHRLHLAARVDLPQSDREVS